MSNQSIQTVSTSNDKYKIFLAIALALAGIVAFYLLAGQEKYIRLGALIAGLVLSALVLLLSESGRELFSYGKESIKEAKKVVWPSRKEAMQMTGVVFVFVLMMAIYLWGADSILEYFILDVILGFKK
jgi:preprotein translocase subunit SecE